MKTKITKKQVEARDSKNNSINRTPFISLKEETMKSEKTLINKNVGNRNETPGMKVVMLDINTLEVPQHHPRKHLGDTKTLQDSIERDGLQKPLLVSKVSENKYEVTDGGRRLGACKKLTFTKLPCIIIEGISASDAAHRSYVINTERNSLDPIEKATHLKTMTDKFGYSLRDLEIKGYGSPASIGNKMKLLELDETVQKQIQTGELTVAHGLELVKISNNGEQKRMAERVIDKNWTAKTTATHINRYLAKTKKQDKLSITHHAPSGISNDSMDNRYDISQIPDESVHMIFTAPEYSPDYDTKSKKYIFEECARVLVPGGVMVLYMLESNPSYDFRSDYSKSQFQPGVNNYLHSLRKNNVYLTDRILLPYIRPKAYVDEEADHTSYRIYNNYWPFYIFRKKGIRAVPSEEIVKVSKLTKEEQETWTSGVWKPVHEKKVGQKEIISPFIKMFSYRGDIVFNPFRQPNLSEEVIELNRIGIDSNGKLNCKPEIKRDFGIESTESGSEASETLLQFFNRMIGSEADDYGPSIESIPVEREAEVPLTEQVEEVKEASDESSETMAEFFERSTASEGETSEPSVETVPVITGKTFTGIESAEEFSEASMPG